MSNTIDSRVVSLEFDNSKFERNVATSMSTLDKLKEKLHFKGATDGLAEIEAAGDRVELGGLAGAVENVKSKFSALETIAVGALINIGSRAVDAGEKLVRSLSVDQIATGMSKYERKMTAVQTIMNATGESIETVADQLERVNWFTDETSFDYSDIVDNISKFTNNNIELNKAINAMMGVSTLAGISGANKNQASMTMRNLSQAMGMGYLGLQDWYSLENAQMTTMEFRQTLIDTAVEMGTVEKTAEGMYRSLMGTVEDFDAVTIRNSLTKGRWATADVVVATLNKYGAFATEMKNATDQLGLSVAEIKPLIEDYTNGTIDLGEAAKSTNVSADELGKTLEKLSGDEYELGRRAFYASQVSKTLTEAIDYTKDAVSTGWMATFEHIFGDFEKASALWSDLSDNFFYDLFVEPGERRNLMLAAWEQAGGREVLLEGLWNILNSIKDMVATVREAFSDIFPPMTGERLKELTERFRDFTEKFKMSEETAARVKNTFKGVFSVFKILWTLLKAAGTVVKPFIELFGSIGKSIFGVTGGIGESISAFAEWLANSSTLQEKAQALANWLRGIPDALGQIFEKITGMKPAAALEQLRQKLTGFVDSIKKAFKSLGGVDENGTSKLEKNVSKLTGAFEWLRDKGTKVWDILKQVVEKIKEFFGIANSAVGDGEDVTTITDKISEFGEKFSGVDFSKLSTKTDSFKKVVDKFKSIFDTAKGIVKTIWGYIKGGAEGAKEGLTKFFQDLKKKLENFDTEYIVIWARQFKRTVDVVLEIITGIAILRLVWEIGNLTKSLTGVVSSVKGVFDQAKAIETEAKTFINTLTTKLRGGKLFSGFQAIANGIKMIGEGVALIAGSILALALVKDKDALTHAALIVGAVMAGLGILTIVLTGMLRSYEKYNNKKGKLKRFASPENDPFRDIGLMILTMSVGIYILAAAMKKVAKIGDIGMMWTAMGVLAILFVVIAGAAAGLSFLAHKVRRLKGKTITDIATTTIIMSAAVLILATALRKVAKIGDVGMMWTAMGVLSILFVVTAGMAAALAIAADKMHVSSSKFMEFAAMFLVMSAALVVMAIAMRQVAKIGDAGTMWNAMGVLVVMTIVISAMLLLAAGVGTATKGIGVAAMAVMAVGILAAAFALVKIAEAITIIEGPVTRLGALPEEQLTQGLVALGVILGELAITAGIIATFPTAVVSAIAILEIVYAVQQIMEPLQTLFDLAVKDWAALKEALVALGIILGELALTADAMALFPTSPLGATGALIVVEAVSRLVPPLQEIYKLARYDWKAMQRTIVAIGEVLTILTTATWLTAAAPPTALLNAQAMQEIVDAVCKIPEPLKQLGNMKWAKLKRGIKAMDSVLASLVLVLMGSSFQDILGMARAHSISTLAASLKEIPDALNQLGEIDTAAADLGVENIGKVLNKLKSVIVGEDGVYSFNDLVADILGEDRANAIATLADTLPEIADAVTKLIEVDPDAAGTIITNIGDAFGSFGRSLKESPWFLPGKRAEGISLLIGDVDDLTAVLPAFMKVVDDYSGEGVDGADKIGTAVTKLGEAFGSFGRALKGSPWFFAEERAQGIGVLIDDIKGLNENLPGFIALLDDSGTTMSSSPMSKIADMYGGAFGFESTGGESKVSKVSKALDILGTAFVKFGAAIRESGLPGMFNGEGIGSGIESMAYALRPLIDAVADFEMKFKGLDSEYIGGIFDTLGTGITTLGRAMGSFGRGNNLLGNIATGVFSPGGAILGGLASAPSASDISGQIVNFRQTVDALVEFKAAIRDLPAIFNEKIATSLATALNTFGVALHDFPVKATEFSTLNIVELVDKVKKLMTDLSTEYVDSLKNGLEQKWPDVNNKLSGLIGNSYFAVKSITNYNKFKTAGAYLVQGLISGMNAEAANARATMEAIANGIKMIFQKATGEQSPSKVFRQYGVYIDRGLILGLEDYTSRVNTASEAMAQGAIDAARLPFEDFTDDWNETMTITPVLDLSQIQNDRAKFANSVSGFNVGASVSLAEQTAASMARRQKDEAGKDAGIEKLTSLVRDLVENPPSVNHNEFNITSDDPEEVADAVERRLTRSIERRNAIWRR